MTAPPCIVGAVVVAEKLLKGQPTTLTWEPERAFRSHFSSPSCSRRKSSSKRSRAFLARSFAAAARPSRFSIRTRASSAKYWPAHAPCGFHLPTSPLFSLRLERRRPRDAASRKYQGQYRPIAFTRRSDEPRRVVTGLSSGQAVSPIHKDCLVRTPIRRRAYALPSRRRLVRAAPPISRSSQRFCASVPERPRC
jgi:hypothetical protein